MRTRPRPAPHGRRPAHAGVALIAVFALAAACAPLTAPVATNDAPPAQVVTGDESAAQRRSAGCHSAPATASPDRVVVAGTERTFLARAPSGPSSAPRDLVIAFHGRTNDAAQARRYFRLDGALPEAVIVYPQALPATPGTFAWADPGDPPDALRDFELVDAIIDAFGETSCIDLERVFVVGHSLGAYFANDVACRLGDRVRAVASVAGGLQGGRCIGGTAALLIHHPEDALVPMRAGEGARDAFLAANGPADATATPAPHPALATLGCVRYGDADAADPVVWCAHDDATWPSGRYDTHAWPVATPAAIAAFFRHLP